MGLDPTTAKGNSLSAGEVAVHLLDRVRPGRAVADVMLLPGTRLGGHAPGTWNATMVWA